MFPEKAFLEAIVEVLWDTEATTIELDKVSNETFSLAFLMEARDRE